MPRRPEPQASRHLWVSGSRKIIRLWRTATQTAEPQLIAAKALIVNYTFGTGTLKSMQGLGSWSGSVHRAVHSISQLGRTPRVLGDFVRGEMRDPPRSPPIRKKEQIGRTSCRERLY